MHADLLKHLHNRNEQSKGHKHYVRLIAVDAIVDCNRAEAAAATKPAIAE